jgi:hypothetical protein
MPIAGVLLDPPAPGQCLDEDHGQQARRGRPEKAGEQARPARQHVAGDQARQDRVADRVGHHRHAPQDQKHARQRAGGRRQHRHQRDDGVRAHRGDSGAGSGGGG